MNGNDEYLSGPYPTKGTGLNVGLAYPVPEGFQGDMQKISTVTPDGTVKWYVDQIYRILQHASPTERARAIDAIKAIYNLG